MRCGRSPAIPALSLFGRHALRQPIEHAFGARPDGDVRLTAMRDLLTESGSVFVQIGDENVHLRMVMNEVFGADNFVSEILIKKKGSQTSNRLEAVKDFVLWYAKSRDSVKVRNLFEIRSGEEIFDDFPYVELEDDSRMSVPDLGENESKIIAQERGLDGINLTFLGSKGVFFPFSIVNIESIQ